MASVIVHGGAGRRFDDPSRADAVRASLREVAASLYQQLNEGMSAIDVVTIGAQMLEDDPLFNAGIGSAIQSDGSVRLTASIMGSDQKFAGVVNVKNVQNPIHIAAQLLAQTDRVISDDGAEQLAREMELPLVDLRTERRMKEWANRAMKRSEIAVDVAAPNDAPNDDRHGTIGVVVLDSHGRLAAATSTGGRGFERPGRVSDVASPCGTYCGKTAAVSSTGIGEDIVDASLASRVVIRADDGGNLLDAVEQSLNEGLSLGHQYGLIGIDQRGRICFGKTTDILLAAYANDGGVFDTVDLTFEPQWDWGTESP